jgi:hypothetical protein
MHGLLLQFRDGDATLVIFEPEHVVQCFAEMTVAAPTPRTTGGGVKSSG